MKTILTLLKRSVLLGLSFSFLPTFAQNPIISDGCTAAPITLSVDPGSPLDGKVWYSGTGDVLGNVGVAVNLYWSSADNVWYLDFDGQPYFQNTSNTPLPPPDLWTPIDVDGDSDPNNDCPSVQPTAFGGTGIMPVVLLPFGVQLVEEGVSLDWSTASELNNAGFRVLRSADTQTWEELGYVNGAGTSSQTNNYQFIDENPLSGANYYRLRQEDLDGTWTFSHVVTINYTYTNLLEVYPNPANTSLNFNLHSFDANQNNTYQVTDLYGKVLEQGVLSASSKSLDISTLRTGIYFLNIEQNKKRSSVKFIKQ